MSDEYKEIADKQIMELCRLREDLSIAWGNIRRLDQDVRLERETSDALRVENERLRQALTWIAHTYAHQGSMKPLPAIDYQDHARAALSQRDEPK